MVPLALPALPALLLLGASLGSASAADWPDLSKPARGQDGARDVALIVGIEDYLMVPDVAGAEANARDWYAWLHDGRGVQTIKILLGTDATREGILDAARAVAGRAQAGGTVWVVFIGHGAPAASTDDGLLVGVDAQQKASSLEARSVRRGELLDLLKGPQAQTVVVLDACFSGRTAGGELAPGLQPLKPVSARAPASASPGGATVLTAAASDQYTGPLPGAARPAFSYLVLGALWGWGDVDQDGSVTASEAVRYASDALFRTVNDRAQTPSLEAADEGLVLARARAKAGPDLSTIALRPAAGPQPAAIVQPAATPPAATPPAATPPAATATSAPMAAGAGLAEAEAALRAKASLEWKAVEAAYGSGGADVADMVDRFVATYQGASVSAGGQSRPVTVPELALAMQAQAWFRQGGDAAVDTGGGAPAGGLPEGCMAQGQAVLMEIAQMVNSGWTPVAVAQAMVVGQTCYTTADIAWLQGNGAPWEVTQAAQSLWVGW